MCTAMTRSLSVVQELAEPPGTAIPTISSAVASLWFNGEREVWA
eukprot:COSAG06_NODE_787_length_12291_cov_18.133694_2_plen_44_part_00